MGDSINQRSACKVLGSAIEGSYMVYGECLLAGISYFIRAGSIDREDYMQSVRLLASVHFSERDGVMNFSAR